jgi:ribosomal protein S27E
MDLSILFSVFNDVLKCPDCGNEMKSHVDMRKKHGYAHYISLQCGACDWKYCFNTSKKKGQSYEINVRATLAFREIGKGHSAMTTFSKVLNMPAPPRRANFTKIQKASTCS